MSASGRIAIVGIGCRVPGARDADALWEIVRTGRSVLRDLTPQELAAVDPAERDDPRYVARGAFLDGIEDFDAGFFGMPRSQAQLLDPQHRLFFECAWEALEDARRMPQSLDHSVGVFAGSSVSAYLLFNLLPGLQAGAAPETLLAMTGNDKDYLASHLAWLLGLRGPTVGVQTACSSSLAAVHLACQALRAGDCALALAGGVSVRVPQHAGYLHVDGSILSPTGSCRSFDARADGTVFASGCAVVALRRLEDALADGDDVLAVIAGSAMNNDGQRKSGFTTPSVDGQAAVIRAALRAAGLQPRDLQQIEAHGTGTPIGDPIEMQALRAALGDDGPSIGIGCAKASFGHLEAAAGVVGLVAAVMALRARERPPVAGFERPNALLQLPRTRFELAGHPRAWVAADGHPRRCGVSSFGIGGTNVHVVLEEAPVTGDELIEFTLGPDPASIARGAPVVLAVSGRSAAACEAARADLLALLDDGCDLEAIGRTCLLGRQAFEHRIAVAAADPVQARHALSAAAVVTVPERPRLAIHWRGTEGAPAAAQLDRFDALSRRHAALSGARLAPVLQSGHGVGAWAALAASGAGWDAVRALLARALAGEDVRIGLEALVAGLPPSAPRLLLPGLDSSMSTSPVDAAGALLAALDGAPAQAPLSGARATVLLVLGAGPAPASPLPQVDDPGAGWDAAGTLATLHAHGVAVDWRALLPDGPMARLPTYPFQRERAWREPPASARTSARASAPQPPVAVGWPPADPVDTPLAARAWRTRITPQAPAWLGQHIVGDQVLMPAAAWLAAGLQAAPHGLVGLELQAPLTVPPEGADVQLSIDPAGAGSLHARRADAAGGWQLQAVFRARTTAGDCGHEDLEALRQRCPRPVDPAALHGRMAAHGIVLGPALRLHAQLWSGDGEALARLADGVGATCDAPVLDASFQALAAAVGPVEAGYLPVSLDAADLAPGAAELQPAWCHARLRPRSADGTLVGDLALLDAQGRTLLRVHALRCRRIGGWLHQARPGGDPGPDLLQLAWRESTRRALPVPQPVAPPSLPWAPAHRQALAALDALCTAWVVDALPALGALPAPGEPLAPGLREATAPALAPLVPRLLAMLRADGWLDAEGRWTPRPSPPAASLQSRFQQAHPGLAQEAALLARCGQALAGVLRGSVDPVDLLFGSAPQDVGAAPEPEPAAGLYHGSRYLDALHALARQALAPLTTAGVPLQVLEVGGGTGSITGHVLDALGAQAAGYCFTDVSNGFLARARQRHGGRPGFSTALFDLERPPADQGIATGRHALAVAANVLHATRDLRAALRHLGATLQPGGWLLMVEGLRPTRWLDLTFGLTQGWWRADDDLRGADGPLLDADGWRALLHDEGYADVQVLTLDAPGSRLADQAVLLARRAATGTDGVHLCEAGLHAPDPAAAVLADLQARLPARGRMLVLTRGAQAVRPWDLPDPAQAAVTGLAKAIAREHPEIGLRVVDLDPLGDPRDLQAALAAETRSEDDEPEVAWRDGTRWVPRLEPARPDDIDLPCWQLQQVGAGLQALAPRPIALPEPGPGEVRIAVGAAGLNFKDVLLATGALGPQPTGVALGGECAGVVDALGPGVSDLRPGQRVVALCGGAFASHVVVPALRVAPIPPELPIARAAALPIAAMTALHALDDVASLSPGQTVVVHAATGGVGHHALALARARGARVVATAGSPAKRAYLRGLGVEHVADSRSTGFVDVVRQATDGRGADVLLNCLGGESIAAGFACLRPGGLFIEIGRAGTWTAGQAAQRHPRVRYVQLALDRLDDAQGSQLLRRVLAAAAQGVLATPPLSLFGPARATDAYRLMQQARHVGRVVLVQPDRQPLRPDRTCVISGGLGGLGLEVAQWALDQGAGPVILLGRQAPGQQAQARLDAWRAAGHDVRALAADVASAADLARVRASLASGLPPVGVLFHAAGVLDDARFEQQDAQRLARVRAPKLDGARLLRATWPEARLVAFSSAAGLIGSPGQANHAAAAAELDAWVLHQRASGAPTQTIDWGAWAEVGAAARRQVGALLAGTGMREITPARGLRALAWAMTQPRGQLAVLPLDRAEMAAAGSAPALLRALVDAQAPAAVAVPAAVRTTSAHATAAARAPMRLESAQEVSLAQALARLPANARLRHLAEWIQAEVAGVLASGAPVPPALPLTEAGIDSLLAIDLRNRLAARSGLSLPGTLLFDHPSVDALATHLLSLLTPDAESPAAARPVAPVAPAALATPAEPAVSAAPAAPSVSAAPAVPSTPAPDAPDADPPDELAAVLAELERKHLQ